MAIPQRYILWIFALILILDYSSGDCSAGRERCEWGPWRAWNDCTATCGGGTRERSRFLCCDSSHESDECLTSCGLQWAYRESERCGGICYNGELNTRWNNCDCNDGYYGSCCENRIDCGRPSSISNGGFSGSNFYYGGRVTFYCNTGYNLTGGSTSRACSTVSSWSSSGYWSGSQPRCAYAISCSSNPCQNGGTCINGLDLYTCSCAHGWSGTNCELDILPPVYDQCPSSITVFTTTDQEIVTWTAPIFTDPHGQFAVQVSAQTYLEPEATLPWGEWDVQYAATKVNNAMTTECVFSINIYPYPCEPLPVPANGSIACNEWNKRFGEICVLFCENTTDVTPNIDIENVYVCGANGMWLPTLPNNAACSETRTEYMASLQSPEQHLHYYDGSCHQYDVSRNIQEAYLDILLSHEMHEMCTSERFSAQCQRENVAVYCN